MVIGFIGQGFIGKSYADDFEDRGFKVVRYSLEEKYKNNRERIKQCDIVFIAVPTPTTPKGFSGKVVLDALSLIGDGKVAVIKSTVLPGFTQEAQKIYPGILVLHSPEFLTAKTAAYDATHPDRNIIGLPKDTNEYRKAAKKVLKILPKAPFKLLCSSRESELIKYGGNNWFYFKVIFINIFYDLVRSYGADWKTVVGGMSADPRIGKTHLDPTHQGGRGAGGACFIKDFAAFKIIYEKQVGDKFGKNLLKEMENKNIELLLSTQKDLELLIGVYGKKVLKKIKK